MIKKIEKKLIFEITLVTECDEQIHPVVMDLPINVKEIKNVNMYFEESTYTSNRELIKFPDNRNNHIRKTLRQIKG
jgi:hypothetical protein